MLPETAIVFEDRLPPTQITLPTFCPQSAVVGLYAPVHGSGKSTFAELMSFVAESRFGVRAEKVAFADTLRRVAVEVLVTMGFTPSRAVEAVTTAKDEPLYELGPLDTTKTGRDLLIGIGTGSRNHIGHDVWVRALEKEIKALWATGVTLVLVDDVRKENEYDFLKSIGGRVGLVKGRKEPDEDANPLEGLLNDHQFDFVVENKGSIYNLAKRAEEVLERIL